MRHNRLQSSPVTAVDSSEGPGKHLVFFLYRHCVSGRERRKAKWERKFAGGATTAQLYFVLQCPTSCINLSRTKSPCVSQPVYSVDWQQAPGDDADSLPSTL